MNCIEMLVCVVASDSCVSFVCVRDVWPGLIRRKRSSLAAAAILSEWFPPLSYSYP